MSLQGNIHNNSEDYLLDIFGALRQSLAEHLRAQGKTVNSSNPSAPQILGFHLLQSNAQKLQKLAGIIRHDAQQFSTKVPVAPAVLEQTSLTHR